MRRHMHSMGAVGGADLAPGMPACMRAGIFERRPAMADMMKGMAKSLTGKRRRYTQVEKEFYSCLQTHGGTRTAMLASINIAGPGLTTMRAFRRKQFAFKMGEDAVYNLQQV